MNRDRLPNALTWPIALDPAVVLLEGPAHDMVGGLETDAEYLAKRDATRADLAELPDGDRIRTFDAYRARVLALPDAIEAASPERREELCRIVVERVVVSYRQPAAIEWVPAVRPFFKRQRECPQGDSNP